MQIIRCDSEKKLKRVIEEYSQFHVYGAGDIGKRVVRYLLKNNISNKNIKVVVTGASTQKALFGNVVIESVSKVASINKDTLTIISARGTTRDEMLETAQQYYSNIAIVEDTLCDELERKVRIPRNKLKFEVHLAEHCNLNCKSCFHYSSIAKEEYLDIVFDKPISAVFGLSLGEYQKIITTEYSDKYIVQYIMNSHPSMFERGYIYDTHNAYVGALIMTGIAGILTLFVFLIMGLIQILKVLSKKQSTELLVFFAILVFILITSFFDSDLFFRCTSTSVLFWLISGFALKYCQEQQ